MRMIDNWQRALKLRSVQFSLLAAFLSAAEVGYTYYMTGTTPLLALAGGLFSLTAGVSRVIAQPGVLDG